MKPKLFFGILLLLGLHLSNYAQDNANDTSNQSPVAKMLLDIGTAEVGMKFTSKDFTYESNTLTKSREQITIKPKDVNDVHEIYLIVYPDGTADLRINSNSRQTIAYQGNITALKPVK
jgi:hypothetical protein